jgi:hypothetical protein
MRYPLDAQVPLVIFLYKPPTGVATLVVDVGVELGTAAELVTAVDDMVDGVVKTGPAAELVTAVDDVVDGVVTAGPVKSVIVADIRETGP